MGGYNSLTPGSDFVEGVATAVVATSTDSVVFFPALMGWTSGGQDSNGWIDVRGLDNVVVLATANTQGATVTVKSRRTSVDPVDTNLAAATGITTGATTAVYDSTVGRISHIRILQRYTTTPGGTVTVSFLAE